MRDIIRVESKRIFNIKKICLFLGIVLIYSISCVYKELKAYNIYNSEGKIEIKAMDNLRESKNRESFILNEDKLIEILEKRDKSNYLYNMDLIKLVILNYDEKKFDEITEVDMKNFYENRNRKLKENIEKSKKTEEEKVWLKEKIEDLDTPLKIGYGEGWKNLNGTLSDISLYLIILISIITLQVLGEEPKIKMKELCLSSKNGQKKLVRGKIITGIILGIILYIIGIGIFSIIKLSVFGVEGYNLKIQTNLNYFYSLNNITYLEQYLWNIGLGLISLLFMILIVYVTTILAKKILSAGVILTFLWLIMIVMPKGIEYINKYFLDFLPYNITNFRSHYMKNEIYKIGDIFVESYIFIAIILTIICLVTFFILLKNRDTKCPTICPGKNKLLVKNYFNKKKI